MTDNGENFEIVFISSDRDEKSFKEYYETMPWLALPFSYRDKKVGILEWVKIVSYHLMPYFPMC